MTATAEKKPAAKKPAAPKKPAAAPKKAAAPKPAPKAAAAKAAKPAAPAAEVMAEAAGEAVGATVTKIKELVARIAEATGQKKGAVKEIVEATLGEIGKALEQGEALHLPGLGRLRVSRSKAAGTGTVMSVKVKRAGAKAAKNTSSEPLAEDGEAG